MSAIVTTSKCVFCGEPAEFQCDWKHVLKEERWKCKDKVARKAGHPKEHVNTWYTSCFRVMCYRCVMELDDNHHRCMLHVPVIDPEVGSREWESDMERDRR